MKKVWQWKRGSFYTLCILKSGFEQLEVAVGIPCRIWMKKQIIGKLGSENPQSIVGVFRA